MPVFFNNSPNPSSNRDDGGASGPVLVRDLPLRVQPEQLKQPLVSARHSIENHPYFSGRSACLQFAYQNHELTITGRVPTAYLKNLAEEVVQNIPEVDRIVNQITVTNPRARITDADAIRRTFHND